MPFRSQGQGKGGICPGSPGSPGLCPSDAIGIEEGIVVGDPLTGLAVLTVVLPFSFLLMPFP